MNKHCLGKALIALFLLAGIAQAQETKAAFVKPEAGAQLQNKGDESEAVYDDDGGRVFILRRNAGSLSAILRHHGGSVIAEPEQHSVFLGSGWAKKGAPLASIEQSLTGLLASLNNGSERDALNHYGVRNLFASSFNHGTQTTFTDKTINDLQIRAELARMFKEGILPAPSANALYVVYLAPGLRSTLGTMFGGKHYLAYHNYFNTESSEIHYVVVPFEANKEHLQQVAQRALIEAVINPSGNGWY